MFNELMDAYKDLPTIEKRKKIENELKEIIAVLDVLCEQKNIQYRKINSSEIVDYENGNKSEDNYLEAMFTYVMWLKEVVGSYCEKTID